MSREGVSCPTNTLNLKKGIRTYDFQPNEPPPKFMELLFPRKRHMALGYNLQPLLLVLWGGGRVILKDIINGPINHTKQNDHLKVFFGCAWGNDGYEGGGCPPITFDY